MKSMHKSAGVVLLVLLLAAGYGIFRTTAPVAPPAGGALTPVVQGQPLVDQTPLLTAQRLAQMPTLAEEQPFAQEALRLGDQEMDLAFAIAMREAADHPPALTPEAKQIQARQQKAEKALDADQAQVAQLTAAEAKATGSKKDALDDDLDLAKAQMELDQDEVDDAKLDLTRAGGDPQGRIQAMVEEHEAASHASDSTKVAVTPPSTGRGLINLCEQWLVQHYKQLKLWHARQQAEAAAKALSTKHDALDVQIQTRKAKSQEPAAPTAADGNAPSPEGKRSGAGREASATRVKATKERSARQKALATFDKRIDNEKELAGVYAKWIDVVAADQRKVVNRILRGVAIILAIALMGLFVDEWIARLLGRTALDRRQVETLRAVTSVSLQIFGVMFILLVIFGMPQNFGTFLGLAGAGLTVALKDFIVGFIGWFVLMGKNGMRLGDWVEINGVTGEVVELGMFHTVLLETGNWTDSGHPTGRRVTFTNSFAIEGHYFNFSTSGQWLWDELQVVLPSGQNPYPIVDAIKKKVLEATADTGRKAEQEWRSAAKSGDMSTLSAAPAINVKPVIGGVEIAVRYITSAHERYQLRSKLNQIMVDLLGPQARTTVAEAAEGPGKA